MPRPFRITLKRFEKACEGSFGIISVIAKKLGVDRSTVYKFLEREPEAQKILEKARDEILDEAEQKLAQAVKDGQRWAIRFLLATLGSKRGYVKKVEMDLPNPPTINFVEVKPNVDEEKKENE